MTANEIAAHNARTRTNSKQAEPVQSSVVLGAPTPSKYRNVKVIVDGEKFDSQAEARHWQELKIREKAGEISALARQVHYELRCPIDLWPPDRDAIVCEYIADFRYCDSDGKVHTVDVKGGKATKTKLYQLKKKWLYLQSGIEIEEIG